MEIPRMHSTTSPPPLFPHLHIPANPSLIHNPQPPTSIPPHTLQDPPFSPRKPRLPPHLPPHLPLPLGHPPTIHLLLSRPYDLLVRRYGLGGGFEPPVDGAIDCAAEGFTYALCGVELVGLEVLLVWAERRGWIERPRTPEFRK